MCVRRFIEMSVIIFFTFHLQVDIKKIHFFLVVFHIKLDSCLKVVQNVV